MADKDKPTPALDTKPTAKPAAPPEDKTSAAARLRAFEDEVLGKDAVRIDGKIERGVGSKFARLTDEQRRQYDALEALALAEQKVVDAKGALFQAEAEHAEAIKATEPRPDPDAPKDKPANG
jgi:hypothetical protein